MDTILVRLMSEDEAEAYHRHQIAEANVDRAMGESW
jgi:hypothetical protein